MLSRYAKRPRIQGDYRGANHDLWAFARAKKVKETDNKV